MTNSTLLWKPEERKTIINKIHAWWSLIKYDSEGRLPLKSGGTTDIYVNLREARGEWDALEFIAGVYLSGLYRLEGLLKPIIIERLVEVPDSVSCFAPLIAVRKRIPYTTIRAEAKEGRVAHAKAIARPKKTHEKTIILDDVITDGASKIGPYWECLELGMDVVGILVLVDREQGWQETFRREGIDVPVYAAMTLSDVREYMKSI